MNTPTISVSVAAASAALLWTIFDAPTLYEDDLQSRSAMTFVWFLSDDLINFVQDPAIASPSVAGAVAATSMDSSKLGVFEPLTEWLRMGVVRATGATGFGMLPQMRLVSRALHICNVLLAALLLPAFLQSRPRGTSVLPHICGFAAASVVGSMAERVEVVSWPSANGYLLGTCLALLMCHVHVALGGATWALYPRVYRWLLCGLLTAAAALSKAACITVFVAPALLDAGTWLLFAHGAPATTRAYPKRPRDAERPAEHTGLLALVGRLILEQSLALSSGAAVASLATKASALDQRRALQPEQQLSASQRGLRALAMLGQHYRRVVRPSEGGLAVRYYAPHAALSADNSALLSSASIGACILGLALFTLLGALTQRLCGQPVRGLLAAGAVAALMALGHALVMLPTLGLLSNHIQTVGADRYSYCADFLVLAPATALGLHALCSADAGVKEKSHPSTGVGVKEKITTSRSFGWGVQARRALAALAVGALLYANATASRAQLQRWRTNEALADDMIEQSRGLDPVPMVHRAIAVVESDPSKAIELLLRVQSHTPHPKVWLHLARTRSRARTLSLTLTLTLTRTPTPRCGSTWHTRTSSGLCTRARRRPAGRPSRPPSRGAPPTLARRKRSYSRSLRATPTRWASASKARTSSARAWSFRYAQCR